MINVAHSVVIGRPVDEVFAYVADQTNEPEWHTDVLEVRPRRSIELGARVTWLVKFMGKSRYTVEVTAFEPGHRIELTTRDGAIKPTLTHTFEQADGGTRYQRRLQIAPQGMFRLMAPVMKATGAASRRNAGFAENLKSVLER